MSKIFCTAPPATLNDTGAKEAIMHERRNSIRYHLEQGTPYAGLDDEVPQDELEEYTTQAEEAALVVHEVLWDAYERGDTSVVIFDDFHTGEQQKYLSLRDSQGAPSFFAWDAGHSATDIGVRTINPAFAQTVNPTTIIHADTQAKRDLQERGALPEVIEAVEAVGRLNEFITERVVRPYLGLVAEAAAVDKEAYLAHFFDRDRRLRILTRVILYHTQAMPMQRPVGSDGMPLLIAEHNDRSSWTVDVKQTAPGLQYWSGDQWADASTRLSAFRGAADSYLPFEAPPALHRAVVRETTAEHRLAKAGIARIAIPTFVSPVGADVRVVRPNSQETRPILG